MYSLPACEPALSKHLSVKPFQQQLIEDAANFFFNSWDDKLNYTILDYCQGTLRYKGLTRLVFLNVVISLVLSHNSHNYTPVMVVMYSKNFHDNDISLT